jgi:hypothetical protein
MSRVVVDLKNSVWQRYREPCAEPSRIPDYEETVTKILVDAVAENGNDVVDVVCLTGTAPVWLYLVAYEVARGYAATVVFNSPTSGEVIVYER